MKRVACRTEGLVLGDGKPLPFKDETFDVVSFFSVLHHLYDVRPYFKEAYRVIKSGGILYTDHDLDNDFFRSFKYPIRVYRKLFDRSRKIAGRKAVSEEAVRLSEFRSEGLRASDVSKALKDAGFRDIKVEFHWLGLNPLVNKLSCGRRGTTFRRGFAPLMSATAVK
jgi:ubiquinone/menaquinone biosynthesis C-methylase UbiE